MPLKKPMLSLSVEESDDDDDSEEDDVVGTEIGSGSLRRGMAGLTVSGGGEREEYEDESPPGEKRGRSRDKPLSLIHI